MSPKNNHLRYLCYFQEAMKELSPAVAIAPERYAVDVIDYHYRDPADIGATSKERQYTLKMQAEGRRYCQRCGHWRPTEYFARYTTRYDAYCKECRRNTQREYRARKQQAR